MPRRVLLVIGTIGLIGLSACAVATRQAALGGAHTYAAPVIAPASESTSSGRAPVRIAPTDPKTTGPGQAPGAPLSGSTNEAPSTSPHQATTAGGAQTSAGNLSGGQCTTVPFVHCYSR
jgi:hypothetical protein